MAALFMKSLSLSCKASNKQNLMFLIRSPVPPWSISGTQTMLHFGEHLAEDLDGWCPEQWVALGANLDPQLLEHRLLVLLASLVFPQ